MKPRIDNIGEKKLVGIRMKMSLSNNQTRALWQSFMSRREEIRSSVNNKLYSMQIYDVSYFHNFNPNTEFEKWAAIEVEDFDDVPDEMEIFTIKEGIYAVFLHKGAEITAAETFQYIFGIWLPTSEYTLDNRPHFEILGEKYKNNDLNSEEEIWIPVKPNNKIDD